MKLVIAIVRPERANDVLEALYAYTSGAGAILVMPESGGEVGVAARRP
ncbi:MAG TPA: hypothetical protein VE983_01340 [Solirubrobacteraceae bacterium]|nr:hypothetical protein [Solirubrobacteraceae bacterium]